MSTNKQLQEQISAMADGELSDVQIDQVLAMLRTPQGRTAWDDYHRIGDMLRSDDMAFNMSDGFAARMSARLEAEPTVVAPVIRRQAGQAQQQQAASNDNIAATSIASRKWKRYAMPGAAAAAIASAAIFFSSPHLMVASKEGSSGSAPQIVLTAAQSPAAQSAASALPAASAPAAQEEAVVLRDPRIDEYLLAHQRFSPSMFSTAQYARSATFATDSGR
jgi:sigma-E factor negative regulatory protein RseA